MISQYRLLFPVELIPQGAKVLLYGAGKTGKHYLQQLLMTGYCNIVGIIDKKYQEFSSYVVPVYPIDKVQNLEFDFIVIAMQGQTYNKEIISDLNKFGVPSSKIIYMGQREDVPYSKTVESEDQFFERDFSLESGERSTAKTIGEVRNDHLVRYQMVADFLEEACNQQSEMMGLDCFCGTGYGSAIIAERLPEVHILSVDGSEESTTFGNKYFPQNRVWRTSKIWPFGLPRNSFDFVVSFESIEHVPDGEKMIETLVGAIKPGGFFFCSVPNARVNSLELNRNVFHHKHWKSEDIEKILSESMTIINKYGQDMFYFENGIKCGVMPPEEMILKENHEGAVLVYICKKG